MAQIRIKRTFTTAESSLKLKPGELGLRQSNLFYGPWITEASPDAEVTPLKVAIQNGNNTFEGDNTFTKRPAVTESGITKQVMLQGDVPDVEALTLTLNGTDSDTKSFTYNPVDGATINLPVYTKAEVDNEIKTKVAAVVKYGGAVKTLPPDFNLINSVGDFVRYSGSSQATLPAANSVTEEAVTVHTGDTLVCEHYKGSSSTWSVMHGGDWRQNDTNIDGYVPGPKQTDQGLMWITDNSGKPGWSNVFQNSKRPVIGGQTTYTGAAAQLAMRGEVGIVDVDIEANVGDAVTGGYSLTLQNGEAWTVGTSGVQTLKVANENDVVTAYLPETTKIYDGSKYVNLSDFGGAIKSISLNGGAAISPTDGTVTLPFINTSAPTTLVTGGGVATTWNRNQGSGNNGLSLTIGTIDCGQWS